jgi:hypothetical protein
VPKRNEPETVYPASDSAAADNMRAAVAETNELNAASQPLGYAVTCQAGGGAHKEPATHRRFTVHRIDHPVAHGPSFESADDVRSYLDALKKLPRWRLDLDDNSVEFDNRTLTVTDKRSGEGFCLKGWKSFGINGVLVGAETPGAAAGTRYISVVADEPPTIGDWTKLDAG